ncbi:MULTISPECIES: TonB-dependent receptor domain-containing protein [unclassified Sphingomonas]|uniref:TonB-dependent receptor domain-containing protein n=1 Tax=unclassified Sphingomonas TaxID=196159 RepID=UPI000B32D7FB|nr:MULTISPECIES: TonB-dependent receptor [unclassified Sphingomonas]
MRRTTRLLASAAVTALVLGNALPALAQATTGGQVAGDASAPGDDTITVTGSRIAQPGAKSNSPITTVDAAEIKLQGATNIESVLNRLPQITADSNENVSNGSDGTARVNLRNLGSNRNLVLVNGQRLLPIQATDLNFIPSFMIQRVDVMSGGASAVYGSDAVSGVINFVLRDNLNGVKTDVQYGFSAHHNDNAGYRDRVRAAGFTPALSSPVDGQRFDANIAMGANFAEDRGNVTAYFGYRDVRPILQYNRDVSACALDPVFSGNPSAATALTCGGSSNNQFGRFVPLRDGIAAGGYNNTTDGNKTWVQYNPSFRYNYAPLNYFQRNDTRFTAGAFAKYQVNPAAEIYGSFMFMDDRTNSQIAPSALFQGYPYSINCNNPLMSAQQATLLCGAAAAGTNVTQDVYIGYRPVAAPAQPRRDDLRHTDYRVTGGVKGQIAPGVRYDANALFSTVIFNETYQNDIDPARANRALKVDLVNGVPTCRSVIDGSDPSCVPLNVFQFRGPSAEALNYVYAPTSTEGLDRETVLAGTISLDGGEFGMKLPWAENGIGAVFGVEHRRESLEFRADALAIAKGTKEISGAFNVTEGFTEIRVPIVEDRPFFDELSLTGGYRFSKYSTTGKGISTYKGEIAWAPSADLRLRGGYNRAIRAPNISELFGAQSPGNVTTQDPCSGTNPAATFQQCQRTGVTAAQYGKIIECPSEQCTGFFGGNQALRPEEADTYTAGIVLTPRFAKRLMLSVDYFNIKVKDYIGVIPVSLTISQCIATGDPFFCSLFNRNPRNGVLFGGDAATAGYVTSTTQNTGSLGTSGLDVAASYAFDTAIGRFGANMVGTWLRDLTTEPLTGLGKYDCKGLYGGTCGQPSPEWRHQARFTWTSLDDKGSISLNWRYIGATDLSFNTTDPFLQGSTYKVNARLPVANYFDLAASASVLDDVTLRIGVNNLLDRDPPAIAQGVLASFGNGNTYPGVYDVAGRTFFVGLSAEF